jgi:hypothetical protein
MGFSARAYAQENRPVLISEETKTICNQVMVNIYRELLEVKRKYKELAQFDESTLYETEQGIYAIVYQYRASAQQVEKYPFEFGITIVDINDMIFAEYGERYAFNLTFPLLGIKFAGYQKRNRTRYRYDIAELINKHGFLLARQQQKYMPLKLELAAKKTVYNVDEYIEFEVKLTNDSNKHMWVKSLNEQTLYCLFDERPWGTRSQEIPQATKFVLQAGQFSSARFLGEALSDPKDFEIYCTYNMSVNGIKPFGLLKVKVQ